MALPNICKLNIVTDLKNDSFNYTHDECKQGDTLIITGTILDNSVMADLTGFACRLNVNKAHGKGYEIRDVTVTVSNGTIFIKCPRSVTQYAGTLLLELQFVDTINDYQKTSFDISIEVKKSVLADDIGEVPKVIITALEELTKQLNDITSKVQEAYTASNILNGTITNANNVNTNLIANTNKAESNIVNLLASIEEAKNTIEVLKQTNSDYTEHIKNADIHVTANDKAAWNLAMENIAQLFELLGANGYYTDENDDYYADEEGNYYAE